MVQHRINTVRQKQDGPKMITDFVKNFEKVKVFAEGKDKIKEKFPIDKYNKQP